MFNFISSVKTTYFFYYEREHLIAIFVSDGGASLDGLVEVGLLRIWLMCGIY